MPCNPIRQFAHGFTLVEMLLVLALVAIGIAIAGTALQPLIQKNRMHSAANRLQLAINLARSEAILRNVPVSLCPSDMHDSGEPECSGHYAGGWIVFANADRDRVVDAGVDEVLQVYPPLPQDIRLTNRSGDRPVTEAIHYLPDGSSRRNRTFMLCSRQRPELQSLNIVLNIVGRPRLEKGRGVCSGLTA